jgi:flagellar biosynthesis/type III secretory pathway M-ring protein FliF/YscJ
LAVFDCIPRRVGAASYSWKQFFDSDEPRRNHRASVIVYRSVAPWVWIVIVAGVVLAIWLFVVVTGTPARRRKAKREQAERLRREAEEKLASSARRQVAAKQEAAAAEREREAAEQAIAHADALDPDLPDSRSDADHDAMGERPAGNP